MPLHYWLMVQQGDKLSIYTRWQDEAVTQVVFEAIILDSKNAFKIQTDGGTFEAQLQSSGFIVLKWVLEQQEDGRWLPTYDATFRPRDSAGKKLFYHVLTSFLSSTYTAFRLFGLGGLIGNPLMLIR